MFCRGTLLFHAIATWPTLTCPILTLASSSPQVRATRGQLELPSTSQHLRRPRRPRHASCPKRSASPWPHPPLGPHPSPRPSPSPAQPLLTPDTPHTPAHARRTGNVGVMINTSTQPIGIICRIRYSTNADPRCLEKPHPRPCPHKPHTLALRHTDPRAAAH